MTGAAYDVIADWYESEFLAHQWTGAPVLLSSSSRGYLDPHWVPSVDPTDDAVGRAGQVRDKVGAVHLPLHELLNYVIDAGFSLERTLEGGAPTPITSSVRCSAP